MSKQLKSILFLGFFLVSQVAFACSCERRYFCEFVKFEESDYKMVAVRAKVLNRVSYEDDKMAAYLEVLEEYRDDVSVGNFIKIYGDYHNNECRVNINLFTPMTEVLLIVGVSTTNNGEVNEMSFPYENPIPDTENYWEFSPIDCQVLILQIDEGIVKGKITEEIREYPWEFFNDNLAECDFNFQELNELRCADENFIVYPNPNYNGKVKIRNSYRKPPISLIRVFDANGNFVQEHTFPTPLSETSSQTRFIQINNTGLYFLEIHCNEHIVTEQVLVL